MKIEGKFIFKVAGTLTAISLVVALLLGLTNMLTADKIAAINKQKTEEALAKVVSAADCEFPPDGGHPAGHDRRCQRTGRQAERGL